MDDLISRKQALEYISAWQQANAGAETQTEYAVIETCYRMMQNLPTAYDVEAVVKELENEYEWNADCFHGTEGMEYLGQIRAYDNAIRIVKRGGRK